MIAVSAYRCTEGVRVQVRATCNGLAHMGNLCETRAVSTLMPVARIEGLGYALALEETLQDVWIQWPDLLELADH